MDLRLKPKATPGASNSSKSQIALKSPKTNLVIVQQKLKRETDMQMAFEKVPKQNDFHLEIKSNGIAFNPNRILRATRPTGLGLLSMRERVESVGGSFVTTSPPGKGTQINIHVPFTQSEA